MNEAGDAGDAADAATCCSTTAELKSAAAGGIVSRCRRHDGADDRLAERGRSDADDADDADFNM